MNLLQFTSISIRWKKQELTNTDAYHEFFKKVIQRDKYIARMYDDQRGSTYLLTLIGLLNNKVPSESDLGEFSEDLRNHLLAVREVLK